MMNFLNHIVNRHVEPMENIKPRIKSAFDHESSFPGDGDTNDEQVEERISPEKQTVGTNAAVNNDPVQVSQNRTMDKTPGAIYEKNISTATETNFPGNKIQPRSITVTTPLEETGVESKENKPINVRERIISRLQAKYLEKHFDTKEEELIESNTKMKTRPKELLPVFKEMNQPTNEETKSTMLKEKGSANNYSPLQFVNNKAEQLVPKISSAKTSSQTINISIDRVEIKAQLPQPETKIIVKKEDKSILSLDQYLESRKSR